MPPVEQGKIFKKSIEEVFELAGFNKSNEDVYFLGYSRGVLSALTLLDEADKSSNPPLWYKTSNGKDRLKGLISLSGSLNGSFADSFYEKDDLLVATGKKLEEKLDKLVPDMKYFDENYDVIFGEAGNTEDSVIIPVLNLLAELQGELPLDTTIKLNFGYTNAPFLQLPKLTDDRIKAESKGRRLDRIIGSNVNKIAGIVENLTEGLYFIDAKYRNPDCDDACKAKYARSITALKSLRYVIPGLISMQESRLKDFWSSLELPNQVKYFSLSTTLPEPHKGFVESNTPEYAGAYDMFRSNIDNLVNRVSYYAYVDNLGYTLNDGQVAVQHSMFRHDYLSMGTGKSYTIVDLGVVGASHWEVAINPAFITPEKWNPKSLEKPQFHTSILNSIAKIITTDNN